ncbi:MAG: response regulator [Thermodesulfobacteriota bacterium]
MKNVLIVDDEQGFLLSLQELCKEHVDKFRIITAGNGKEALDIMASQDISLVVTDLKMPVMDGFELASRISRLDKSVPVIVMTAFGTPEMEDRLMNMGAFQYIEKPIDYALLLQKIQDGLAAGTRGHVTGISLPSFLQLLELDSKTCTIVAKSGPRVGLLFFLSGALINAYTDPLEGLDAAFEIIGWQQAEITIYDFCQNRKRTIDAPLGFILIEGMRRLDEQTEKTAADADAPSQDDELDRLDELDFATAPLPPPPTELGGVPSPAAMEERTKAPPEAAQPPPTPAQPTGGGVSFAQAQNEEPLKSALPVFQDALARAIGPIAAIITKELTEKWLQAGACSAARFPELADAFCTEIGDPPLEKAFRNEVERLLGFN